MAPQRSDRAPGVVSRSEKLPSEDFHLAFHNPPQGSYAGHLHISKRTLRSQIRRRHYDEHQLTCGLREPLQLHGSSEGRRSFVSTDRGQFLRGAIVLAVIDRQGAAHTATTQGPGLERQLHVREAAGVLPTSSIVWRKTNTAVVQCAQTGVKRRCLSLWARALPKQPGSSSNARHTAGAR